VGLKILYRNPRRPGEAGIKLVPDQSQKAAEREILERLGFTVIEMTPVPFTLTRHTRPAICREHWRVRWTISVDFSKKKFRGCGAMLAPWARRVRWSESAISVRAWVSAEAPGGARCRAG